MKKITLALFVSSLLLISCGNSKKEEAPKKEKPAIEKKVIEKKVVEKKVVEKKVTAQGNAVEGKKLFGSKACSACHHETTKIIGPALKDIAAVYAEKEADILKFLKGESEAIVDTDPTQVAIMKNNVDTMVKDISDADLVNIVAYMNSVK